MHTKNPNPNLTVIDTAALKAELENEVTEKSFAACKAFGALRGAKWGGASKKDIARREREYREATKQMHAAQSRRLRSQARSTGMEPNGRPGRIYGARG